MSEATRSVGENEPTRPIGDHDAMLRRAGRLWWVFLLRGLAGLLLGVAVLLGGASQTRLASFIAMYWLVGALLTIRWVLESRWRPGSRLALAAATAGIVAATLVLARGLIHDATAGLTLDALGVAAGLTGSLRLFGAFHDDESSLGVARRSKRLLLGSLEVVLGVLLILVDEVTRGVTIVAAAWALMGGTILLLDSVKLRGFSRGTIPTG